jgi:hypothetical protein
MGNLTTLDKKMTDFLGVRMDAYHEDLLKKIFAKWKAEGKRISKTPIGEAGVEYVAKLEGLVPDSHLVVGEIRLGLQDEEARLRDEGFKDDDFVNEGVMACAIKMGFMGPTKITTNTETLMNKVCDSSCP